MTTPDHTKSVLLENRPDAPDPPSVSPVAPADVASAHSHEESRRRFTLSALIGLAIAAVPFVWTLWDGRLDPLRRFPPGFFANFYDLQARSLFRGRWDIPDGLGLEAFVVDGREYMYFGPFPAFLRMPVLGITDSVDGRLTAPSMLVAWVLMAAFSALLLWRVRVVVRGSAPLGRAEAASIGVLLAALMGGSVLLFLAAQPAVYFEALIWGAALTVGALFAVLGVLERPSIGRFGLLGALTLAAVLSRSTVGWACVVAALLTAIWLATGRGGTATRRWWPSALAAGLIPLAVGAAVTWVKFGGPFSHPLAAQVYSRSNEHRREFLAATGGAPYSFDFLPSTLLAYFRPDALLFEPIYPFVTLPDTPPDVVGDVVMDQLYRTSSVPASMPLLFVLALWGVICTVRRRPDFSARIAGIPLFAAAFGTGGVLLWGGIANRFLADFLPFLALGAAVGVVALWHRLEGRSRRVRVGALAVIVTLGVFSVATNLGIATQAGQVLWGSDGIQRYVERQESTSDVTGGSLDIDRGNELPRSAPADRLFVMGDCDGLYISTGERYFPRWLQVELGPNQRHRFDITYHQIDQGPVPLLTIGGPPSTTVFVEDRGLAWIRWMRIRVNGPSGRLVSRWIKLKEERDYRFDISMDTALDRVLVTVDGEQILDRAYEASGAQAVHTRPPPEGDLGQATVLARPVPPPSLCRSVLD